jgi:putative endonuclease
VLGCLFNPSTFQPFNFIVMSASNDLGKTGEKLARQFFVEKGCQVLAQNWRYSRAEVDMIVKDAETIVFVEVKTRSSTRFGPPEYFVSRQQQQMLAAAASYFCEKLGHEGEIRFDVISIVMRPDGETNLEHLQDGFWPGSWR